MCVSVQDVEHDDDDDSVYLSRTWRMMVKMMMTVCICPGHGE